jgi:uncharacterized membrane protein
MIIHCIIILNEFQKSYDILNIFGLSTFDFQEQNVSFLYSNDSFSDHFIIRILKTAEENWTKQKRTVLPNDHNK